MRKLSFISMLACLCFIGCGTREKDSAPLTDTSANCSPEFVQDYENTEKLMKTAFELGIGDSNPANQSNEQAAQQACEAFKITHQTKVCNAQDGNGSDVEMKASDVNDECDYFIKSRTPDKLNEESVSAITEAPAPLVE